MTAVQTAGADRPSSRIASVTTVRGDSSPLSSASVIPSVMNTQISPSFRSISASVAGLAEAITFYLDGFRTLSQDVYARPDSTLKLDENMQRLPPGQASAPVPAPNQG